MLEWLGMAKSATEQGEKEEKKIEICKLHIDLHITLFFLFSPPFSFRRKNNFLFYGLDDKGTKDNRSLRNWWWSSTGKNFKKMSEQFKEHIG